MVLGRARDPLAGWDRAAALARLPRALRGAAEKHPVGPRNTPATTFDTAFAWNDFFDSGSTDGQGLSLSAQTLTGLGIFHFASVQDGIADASCFPDTDPTPILGVDDAGRVTYNLGDIGSGNSKTVKFVYRRF